MSFPVISKMLAVLVSISVAGAAPECNDVIIMAGQSNMDGRGHARDLTGKYAGLAGEQADIAIYYANPAGGSDPHDPLYRTGWRRLSPGLAVPPKYTNGLPSGRFGPELSCGRKLVDDHPGCHLAIIKVTQGGTSLSRDWNPANARLYATLTNTIATALKDPAVPGRQSVVKGFLWHQGESDVSGGAETYKKNLTAFIHTLRHDLGMPELPFVIGEIATNKDAAFRAAQRAVAREVPHAALVSADGLETVEGTHFDSASVVALGERFAAEAGSWLKVSSVPPKPVATIRLPADQATSNPTARVTQEPL
jgi:iduronate 2-sulfatase